LSASTPVVIRRALRGACVALLATLVPAQGGAPERVLEVQLLDNGDFSERIAPGAETAQLLPWWRADLGAKQVVLQGEEAWLGTLGEVRARQPIAAYGPLAGGVRIAGRLRGPGRMRVLDGAGRVASIDLDGGSEPEGRAFSFRLEDLALRPERLRESGLELAGDLSGFAEPTPRLTLELGSRSTEEVAYWTSLEAWVPLPCPDESALRDEVIALLDEVFALWREHVIDPETGFACYVHDVVTGERLAVRDGILSPAFEVLFRALSCHEDPEWRTMLEHFLEGWFTRCFHPKTGLPRSWSLSDAGGRDDKPLEIHSTLDFLLELSAHGPPRWRAEAGERLRAIGEHVLARGAMPDGQVAAGYVPGSGAPVLGYSPLRRFDVPAPLARLGALDGDERYLDLARDAVAEFEYTWLWPGTWQAIDPGFDDDYGHYAERALSMTRAWPEEPGLRRVVRGGYDFYAPLWRDALRLGGNIAADQVRGWTIFAGLAELEPELLPEVRALLRSAQRVHFKGEQYENGAWGDVTIFGFDPKAGLQVGDLPGMPQNLLQGLASNYSATPGLRDDETRAMFTAVLRSSRDQYRQPYGYLVTRAARAGSNPGGGSFRLAVPLADMLEALSR
jgi:hypothetical protein